MDYQTRLNSDITKEIDYLASLRKERMVADLRTELVYGTLVRIEPLRVSPLRAAATNASGLRPPRSAWPPGVALRAGAWRLASAPARFAGVSAARS